MIVVKKFKTPPPDESSPCGMEYAYLEGSSSDSAASACEKAISSVDVRIDGMRGGDYLVVYKADFPEDHPCKKLNLTFSGRDDLVMGA